MRPSTGDASHPSSRLALLAFELDFAGSLGLLSRFNFQTVHVLRFGLYHRLISYAPSLSVHVSCTRIASNPPSMSYSMQNPLLQICKVDYSLYRTMICLGLDQPKYICMTRREILRPASDMMKKPSAGNSGSSTRFVLRRNGSAVTCQLQALDEDDAVPLKPR